MTNIPDDPTPFLADQLSAMIDNSNVADNPFDGRYGKVHRALFNLLKIMVVKGILTKDEAINIVAESQ